MQIFKQWFGEEQGMLRRAQNLVPLVNAQEDVVRSLTDDQLRMKTTEFKARLQSGVSIDDLIPEAFAVVREASRRTLGQRHFDVQVIGGCILHWRGIAEMRTGEGKTLVATLPAYLNALEGRGVHVVTVNDYLSRRDAVWMGQVYDALGLSVGVINHESSYLYDAAHAQDDKERDETGAFKVMYDFLRPISRREAYRADITYGTNNEFGFDYLRDNIEYHVENLRQRTQEEGGNHFAIIDEIDSILIDEARTPLIISAPVADAENLYQKFADIAKNLTINDDFSVDEKRKQISLTDNGIEKVEKLLGISNIYTDAGIKFVHHLETAVRAHALYHRDKDYVVQNGEIIIVDEFTGRIQPGRRWSEGLHQAIEAKERVSVQRESRTLASITFQNYFRLYGKIAGMTGTAATSSEEFFKVYGLNTVAIPTNKPIERIDHDDFIFQNESGKMSAITAKVKYLHEKGQPVLVGTASVEQNELLSAHFKQNGVPHQVLNAKNHEKEGEIIAQAGQKAAVTIATNMAGRGVDIKLGGNPGSLDSYEEVRALGGLFVLGTERHEARRIDNQLRGRSGRQGDPGETQFFVSLEDSLMRIFASDFIKKVMGTFKIPEDEPIHNTMITKALEKAQTRIEEFNFDARKHVLAYDDVLNVQRQSIYTRRRSLLSTKDGFERELERIASLNESISDIFTEKRKEFGDAFGKIMKGILLQTIDTLWMEHLEAMEYLRSSVNLRAYGQRDPLVEYKREGLRMFNSMEDSYVERVVGMLSSTRKIDQNLAINQHSNTTLPDDSLSEKIMQSDKEMQKKVFLQADSLGKRGNYERNDMVTITNGLETKTMKFKKAESYITTGSWRIVP